MSIRTEIEGRLAAFAAAQSPPIPVAYENVPFTKPTAGPYLEIRLLASNSKLTDTAALGSRVTGMFQINCYCPLDDGMLDVDTLADAVIGTFPVLPKVGTVSIESPLNSSAAIDVDAFVCVPVTGRFRVEM